MEERNGGRERMEERIEGFSGRHGGGGCVTGTEREGISQTKATCSTASCSQRHCR